ncbi:hypothetical protein Sjap_024711 [Stephania japonica]|uniref:FAD-binding PCMH-type domain-containing protein n=1 Tax=Stephania japonica TaxID=461633 RepID=A0AAP0EE31_9MAGN
MECSTHAILSLLLFVLVLTTPCKVSSASPNSAFLKCLASNSSKSKPQVYDPKSPFYFPILGSSIYNLRFASSKTPKPLYLITPDHESQVPSIVVCSKKHGLKIRVRSGGHDYEGLSYTSNDPFVLIDLINLRTIDVDIKDNSAWVQAGASLGEVYHRIAEKSGVHGFPAGACPTVGVGGHISGGGFGAMVRKYGMAADHVLDARLINAKGEILTKETMGKDLFWAIRGGGVASFGVLLAWKIKLVRVPPIVTISIVDRTLEQGATDLIQKWQSVAVYEVPEELQILLQVGVVDRNTTTKGGLGRTIQATFRLFFLGRAKQLIQLLENKFPELGIKKKDCVETSWAESVVNFIGFPVGTPVDILLNRTSMPKATFKVKPDFVTRPIPKIGLEGIWKRFLKEESPELNIGVWEGKVNEIPEKKIAFPHRAGNMYLIQYGSYWNENEGKVASEKHINWIRELYDYMTPYVSKSPRTAYLNFRDLDLGLVEINGTKYSDPSIWGPMYFKSNFERLMKVKGDSDPDNFFSSEQSIPLTLNKYKVHGFYP